MGEETVAVFAVTGHSTWRVAEIVRNLGGGYSEAVVYVPESSIEDVLSIFTPDTLYDITVNGTKIFTGRPLTPSIAWSSEEEEVRAVFRGPEWDLDRYRMWGRRTEKASGGSDVLLDGLVCIFNEDGSPNKADAQVGSKDVFKDDVTDPDDVPKMWDIETMIDYVVQEIEVKLGSTIVDSISWPSTGKDKIVPHVNVQGLTGREAICEVLARGGMSWSMTPIATPGAIAAILQIVLRGVQGGTPVSVNVPAAGGSLPGGGALASKSASKGMVTLDYVPAIKKLIGYGAPKIYEATFTLLKGWSLADQNSAFGGPAAKVVDAISAFERNCSQPDESSAWDDLRYVGRRYILNETGHEDNPEGLTTPYSFESLFGSGDYSARPRPFLPHRMEKDDEGNFLPVKILVADPRTGDYAIEREYEAELLTEIAGIVFRGAHFPFFKELAIAKDDLSKAFPTTVRVVAAVVSDTAFSKESTAGSPDLTTEVIHILDLGAKFVWDNKNGSSLETDFNEYVDLKVSQWEKRVDGARFYIERYTTAFELGSWVSGLTGRTLTLHGQILGIRWNADQQSTEVITGYLEMDDELNLAQSRLSPEQIASRAASEELEKNLRRLRRRYPTEIHPPMMRLKKDYDYVSGDVDAKR